MKITNAQMFDSFPVLAQAEEKGVLGFAIAQNRRKIAEELKEYSAKRDELLAEYGKEEGAGKYTLTPEAAVAFSAALRPYAELEADVPLMQVSVDDFCGGSLTSSQMYVLDWMVKKGD